jgi:hypothetical protein
MVQDGLRSMTSLSIRQLSVPNLELRKVCNKFQYLMGTGASKDETERLGLRARLNQIDAINIPPDAVTRRPRIMIRELFEGTRLKGLLAVKDWVVSELKQS